VHRGFYVFRSLLNDAGTEAPENPKYAAKLGCDCCHFSLESNQENYFTKHIHFVRLLSILKVKLRKSI